MKIELDTSTASAGELTALIALLASLGGRLPNVNVGATSILPQVSVYVDESADITEEQAAAILGDRIAGKMTELPSEALIALATQKTDHLPDDAGDPNETDAEGIPWDERIHSGNKAKNADGTWRKRRGVDEVTYGRIYGELQERAAAPREPETTGTPSDGAAPTPSDTAPTPSAPPPPATSAAPPPPSADTGNAPAAASAPTEAEPAAPAPAESASDGGVRFPTFAAFVQAVSAIRNPAIPYLELNGHAQSLGVAKFPDMKDHPEHWETFYAMAAGQ